VLDSSRGRVCAKNLEQSWSPTIPFRPRFFAEAGATRKKRERSISTWQERLKQLNLRQRRIDARKARDSETRREKKRRDPPPIRGASSSWQGAGRRPRPEQRRDWREKNYNKAGRSGAVPLPPRITAQGLVVGRTRLLASAAEQRKVGSPALREQGRGIFDPGNRSDALL